MKRSLMILLPALAIMASCGSLSQYASEQRFPDGIYFRPQPVIELLTAEDFRGLAAENLAADSLRQKNKIKSQERNYDYDYYGYYGPFGLYGTYGYPYYYYPWSYYSRAYYALGYPWSLSSYYAWSSLYDPLWDPAWNWGYGFGPRYNYYGYSVWPRYYSGLVSHSGSNVSNPDYSYNHRRAGSLGTGVSTSSYTRSSAASSGRSVNPTRSGGGSSGAYRRSGGISISTDTGSYSGSSATRSSSYSGGSSSSRSYSGGSSYSSGGSSHSSGGGGGGSSHSGGSGGGGGGRR